MGALMKTDNTKFCVLIVEDDEAIRMSMQMVLETEGYEVYTAENGKDALIKLGNATILPDLIFTDLMMPSVTGWELVDILRKTKKFSKLPIVISSAVAQYNTDNRVLDGCYFIRKPSELDVIFAKVKQAIAYPWNDGTHDKSRFREVPQT